MIDKWACGFSSQLLSCWRARSPTLRCRSRTCTAPLLCLSSCSAAYSLSFAWAYSSFSYEAVSFATLTRTSHVVFCCYLYFVKKRLVQPPERGGGHSHGHQDVLQVAGPLSALVHVQRASHCLLHGRSWHFSLVRARS